MPGCDLLPPCYHKWYCEIEMLEGEKVRQAQWVIPEVSRQLLPDRTQEWAKLVAFLDTRSLGVWYSCLTSPSAFPQSPHVWPLIQSATLICKINIRLHHEQYLVEWMSISQNNKSHGVTFKEVNVKKTSWRPWLGAWTDTPSALCLICTLPMTNENMCIWFFFLSFNIFQSLAVQFGLMKWKPAGSWYGKLMAGISTSLTFTMETLSLKYKSMSLLKNS